MNSTAWRYESSRCRTRFSRGMIRTVPLEIRSANLLAMSFRYDKERAGKEEGSAESINRVNEREQGLIVKKSDR